MNKKELQELRRQFKWDNDKLLLRALHEGYGKVNDDGPKLQYTRTIDPFLMEKEEGELYFEIFKKSLGGTPGKNLLEFAFEASDPASKELQNRLFALKNGSLQYEESFEKLALELLEKGDYRNSVYISAALFEYSAPGMNANRESLEDGSIFRFLLVSVSQARLTQIGLYYSSADNQVQRKVNDEMEILPAPLDAFVYPTFSDRAADVNHFLYHCKTPKSVNVGLLEEFFHVPFVATANEQSEGFAKVIASVFPQGLPAKTALKFHENLTELVNEQSEQSSDVPLSKHEVKDLLSNAGAPAEELSHFDSAFTNILEDQSLSAVNLMEKGKVSVKAPSISVSVKDDALEKLQARMIDGRPCLVITLDDEAELSGLPVHFMEKARAMFQDTETPSGE